MELLDKITPGLETVRGFIFSIAEFLSRTFEIDVNNIYLVLILVISIFLSKKLLEFFYTTLDGRKAYWLVLAGIIFWVLKYLGVN